MRFVLAPFAVFMFLISGLRIGTMILVERHHDLENAKLRALIPKDGSLHGIDANGNTQTTQANRKGYLLMFALHHQRMESDLPFWNRVVDLASEDSTIQDRKTEYWGVCDSGSDCSPYASRAHFKLVGYLDPYQMHALAKADVGHEALLYDPAARLKARIPLVRDASQEANLISRQAK